MTLSTVSQMVSMGISGLRLSSVAASPINIRPLRIYQQLGTICADESWIPFRDVRVYPTVIGTLRHACESSRPADNLQTQADSRNSAWGCLSAQFTKHALHLTLQHLHSCWSVAPLNAPAAVMATVHGYCTVPDRRV